MEQVRGSWWLICICRSSLYRFSGYDFSSTLRLWWDVKKADHTFCNESMKVLPFATSTYKNTENDLSVLSNGFVQETFSTVIFSSYSEELYIFEETVRHTVYFQFIIPNNNYFSTHCPQGYPLSSGFNYRTSLLGCLK